MADETVRVGVVGHCGFDSFGLKRLVKKAFDHAEIEKINNESALELSDFDLLLINRKLDGRFGASDGIELIRQLSGGGPALMLISNYEDAQVEAVRAGALEGFGKDGLGSELSIERLRGAVRGS
jgi:DNA-binding NarL/FixJ family response regulator